MSEAKLINGDCIEEMQKLIDDGVKVDMVLTDPPYGTTACKWDTIIPFNEMWRCLNQLTYDDTPILLFGSEPFSTMLRQSNINNYRYDWIWEKEQGANFMNVKYQPFKVHEIISVFSRKRYHYNPIMEKGKPYISGRGDSGDITGNVPKIQKRNNGTRYPRSIVKFNTEKSKSKHPTQKPVKLLEYLIKTYSEEGNTVLDFTMGSGSTGVACMETNRNFIGIELDTKYYEIAEQRINEAKAQRRLI